jgi:hypothetical protein
MIVVDDLPASVVNNSISKLRAEETEEERAEKALALLMERAKEDQLRQKTNIRRVGMVESDINNKKENVGKWLNFMSINKNESFLPNTKRFNSIKEGYNRQGTILLDDDNVVISSDDDDDDLNDFT